jgi:hypothetical protein
MSDYGEGGGFVVRCPRCKGILYKYILGDQGSKDKYIGPPSPRRIYARYDVKNACPFCGAKFDGIPRIKVLTLEQFTYSYAIVSYRGRELLVERDLISQDIPSVAPAVRVEDEVEITNL